MYTRSDYFRWIKLLVFLETLFFFVGVRMGMVGVLCCCYVRRKCCTTNYKGKLTIAQFSSYTLKYMKCIGLSCYNSIHIYVKGWWFANPRIIIFYIDRWDHGNTQRAQRNSVHKMFINSYVLVQCIYIRSVSSLSYLIFYSIFVGFKNVVVVTVVFIFNLYRIDLNKEHLLDRSIWYRVM